MPDHLHALLSGETPSADFREFVRCFKQVSAFDYRRASSRPRWQPGYHERILRDDDATVAVVKYILENPVRAGLAGVVGEYPFAGSDRYHSAELLMAYDWHPERRT